jgi:hypothetical protein
LVEKSAAMRDREREQGGLRAGVGVWSGGGEDDEDARTICTIVPHDLESVEE